MTLSMYFTCISLIVFFIGCNSSEICSSSKYQQFLTKFNITPLSSDTAQLNTRMQQYCRNLNKINEINSNNLTYKAKQYKWMDRNQNELKNVLNFRKIQYIESSLDLNQKQKHVVGSHLVREAPSNINGDMIFTNNFGAKQSVFPQTIDYRTSGYVSSIKDQGSCGSCWAFAAIGLYESWMMWKGQPQYDLSEEYVLQCTTRYTKEILDIDFTSSCSGGIQQYAISLIKNNGAPSQSQFPYEAYNMARKQQTPNTRGICQEQQRFLYAKNPQVTKHYTLRNSSQFMLNYMLAYFGPVTAVIYADQGFLMYQSGVYNGCPQSFQESYKNINHAVLVVGYDPDGNYIIKNSWGTRWGMNGYGIISKDRNCGIFAQNSYLFSQKGAGSGVQIRQESMLVSKSSGYRPAVTITAILVLFFIVNL